MTKFNTWVLDIETKPMVAYVWDRRDVNIALNQLKEDWSIIAWSAKPLGGPLSSVVYHDLRKAKDYNDDRPILLPLWKILDEADIIITQNGEDFDEPKINARFILQGMKRPLSFKHYDTYKLAKRAASFTSTKLEYLTNKLCTKYKKLSHDQYPGQELWTECLKGNSKAWDAMKRYNIHDTLATEELYTKLKEWAPKAFPNPDGEKCAACGKAKVIKVKCTECGKWGQNK